MRVVRYAPATVTWQPTDQNGEQADATGTPTVTITRADGTEITGITPTLAAGTVTVTLPATVTDELDRITIVWKLDGNERGSTVVDVVGSVYVTTKRLKEENEVFASKPDAVLRAKRDAVESWFEEKMARSFVPRFDTYTVATDATLITLPRRDVRRIVWVHDADGDAWDSDDVDDIVVLGEARWGLEGTFDAGTVIGYEHGLDEPPEDIITAVATAVRLEVAAPRLRIDDAGFPIEGLDPDRQALFGTLKRWRWQPPPVA